MSLTQLTFGDFCVLCCLSVIFSIFFYNSCFGSSPFFGIQCKVMVRFLDLSTSMTKDASRLVLIMVVFLILVAIQYLIFFPLSIVNTTRSNSNIFSFHDCWFHGMHPSKDPFYSLENNLKHENSIPKNA